MANQDGVQYKKAYVTTPYQNMDTNVAAVTRSFVDYFVSGTVSGAVDIDETITVGIKLRPGARIVGATIHSDGNGGDTSCVGAIQVTDDSGTTVLSGTVNMQAGTASTAEILPALGALGGYVCTSEAQCSIIVTGGNYDTGSDGEVGVEVSYLDI